MWFGAEYEIISTFFRIFRSDLFNNSRGSQTQKVNASFSRGLFGAKSENRNFRYSWKKVSCLSICFKTSFQLYFTKSYIYQLINLSAKLSVLVFQNLGNLFQKSLKLNIKIMYIIIILF